MDQVSEWRLKEVHPMLADKVRQMADLLAKENIVIRVTQGLRSWSEQEALFAQGRSAPGKIVTQAPPGYSYHNFGLAVDLVPLVAAEPDWNVEHPVWQRLVEVGTSLGLQAGAQWRSFPDYPHFQLVGALPVSPSDEVRQTFLDAGMEQVWKESGLDTIA